jgi:phage I-like protein
LFDPSSPYLLSLGLLGSNLPALALKDEPQLGGMEYGLTDEEEDTLSSEEKKKKLNEQLRELNLLIDGAARKKDGFQRLLAAYEKDTTNNSNSGKFRRRNLTLFSPL